MKLLTMLLAAFVATASLGLSQSAAALTATTFPGSNCHTYYGKDASAVNLSSYGVTNTSTASVWVSCPIDSPSQGWAQVTVAVKAPASVGCYVKARRRDGGLGVSRYVSVVSNGKAEEASVSSAATGAKYYVMYCYLPATAKILWYSAQDVVFY